MAEIKAANLAGYTNPQVQMPDLESSEIRRKQLSMQQGLHKYKIEALKVQKEQTQIGLKSQEWVANNQKLLFQASADATDVDSQYFNDPRKMADLMTDYKNKVGGNYKSFAEFVQMGKANEAKVNQRSLQVLREDYKSDKLYKRALNEKLKGMDPEMRNKLFTQVDDETYMSLANVYDVDKKYSWRDMVPDMIDDRIEPEVWGGGLAGSLAVGAGVVALVRKGKANEAKKLLEKTIGKVQNKGLAWQSKNPNQFKAFSRAQKELQEKFFKLNGKNKQTEAIAKKLFGTDNQKEYIKWRDGFGRGRGKNTTTRDKGFKRDNTRWQKNADGTYSKVAKGTGGANIPATTPDPSKYGRTDVPGGRSKAEQIKYDWMKKKGRILPSQEVGPYTGGGKPYGPAGGTKVPGGGTVHTGTAGNKPKLKLNPKQIQDAEFEVNKRIPKPKIPFQLRNLKYLEKTGQMSAQERGIMEGIIKKLQKNGGPITQKSILDAMLKNPNGKEIVEKVASGAIDPKKMFFGAGVATAMLGGYLGGSIGGKIGEMVGGEKGESIGNLMGTTTGTLGLMPALTVITQKVKEQGMKNVMAKVTTRLGAKTAAKLIAAGIFSGTTMGWGALVSAGFILSDIYAIYDILTEEE